MKTTRKMLTLLMLLCLALGCVSANADTELTATNGTTTAESKVVLDLGEQPTTYTIVIPSQINIDTTTGKGSAKLTLKSGFVLTDITSLQVKLKSGVTNYNNHTGSDYNYLDLRNMANSSTVRCYVGHKEGEDDCSPTDTLISVTNQMANDKDYSKTLYFTVSSLPPYGVYTGTLTFSVVTA